MSNDIEPLLNSSFFTDYLSNSCIKKDNSSDNILDIKIIDDYCGDSNTNINKQDNINNTNDDDDQNIWIFDLLNWLNTWLFTKSSILTESYSNIDQSIDLDTSICDDFWDEWEWVLSRTEEITLKQTAKRAKEIDEELSNLKRSAIFLKKRAYFLSISRSLLFPQDNIKKSDDTDTSGILTKDQLQILNKYPLDSSLRSGLLRDIVNEFSEEWLQLIGEMYFSSSFNKEKEITNTTNDTNDTTDTVDKTDNKFSIYIENYTEKPYSKNVTGALISMGFMASHGSSQCLTIESLADILWTWWRTLIISISDIIPYDKMNGEYNNILATNITKAAPVIIRVWFETVDKTRNLSSLGTLPSTWKKEDELEQKRLENINKFGLADAKYRDGTQLGKLQSTISPDKLFQLKKKLQDIYSS